MPEEIVDNLGIGTEHTEAEDLEFLGGDEFGEEVTEEKETKDEETVEQSEEEPKVVSEKEETTEEEKTEEVEVTPFQRTSFKQVEEKYPNFFKDFPDLRHSIGREQAFTQVFPTLEDAREAKESVEEYNYLRDEILQGKIETLFNSTKEANPDSYKKMVDGFLPTLFNTDKESFFSITEPLLAQTIANVFSRASDENTKNAALVISKHLFGTYDIAKNPSLVLKGRAAPEQNQERLDLEKEKQDFQLSRLKVMQGEVEGEIITSTKELLMSKIFDSKDRITTEAKEVWVDRAFKELDRLLGNSPEHKSVMNSYWKKALQSGMTGPWKNRIKSTYLSRAESLMPTIRARIRKNIFGARVSTPTRKETEESSNGNSIPRKERNYSQMSDREIIDSE